MPGSVFIYHEQETTMLTTSPYTDALRRRTQTPQSESIPGRGDQVLNRAGGYGFTIDKWARLERFLLLGTDSQHYYTNAKTLTSESLQMLHDCFTENHVRAVSMIVDISQAGRAVKNDPAIFALAVGAAHSHSPHSALIRDDCLFHGLRLVCRTGTHILMFVSFVDELRGWGRGLRNGVASWFNCQDIQQLENNALKFYNREGWTLRDLLRKCHTAGTLASGGGAHRTRKAIYGWLAAGRPIEMEDGHMLPDKIQARNVIAGHPQLSDLDVGNMVRKYRLPWEALPTERLNKGPVAAALITDMPIGATLRQLGKMTANGTLKPFDPLASVVAARLRNQDAINRGRVHPIQVLIAAGAYRKGQGLRGKLSWNPVPAISSALDDCFEQSFATIEPTMKNYFIGLDVSSSMSVEVATGISAYEACGAIATTLLRTEPNVAIGCFSNGRSWQEPAMKMLDWTRQTRYRDAIREMREQNFGGTDCALPMLKARAMNIKNIDVFIVMTDSETWSGAIHPCQALNTYREWSGNPDVKLVVCATCPSDFTIADPKDGGMLDTSGFDASLPKVIADFAKS
jgi:60 kDa SS-A/Ro ribonucleoprotein